MIDPPLLQRTEDGVRVLTFNRPTRRNALDASGWTALAEALDAALDDRTVRAVVLTGAGEVAFCAGQDLSEMTALPQPDTPHPFGRCMDALCRFDKVLIAAVNGVAVGGGLTILLHCDFVFVADNAKMRAPFVQLGVIPEAASSYLLPLICGHRGAAEVLYGADWISAERAVALNIATKLTTQAAVVGDAVAQGRRVARHAPEALRHTKRLVLATRAEQVAAARAREDAGFAERIGSAENREAIAAFFERRPPRFD
ncbi:MAG: enoyl-CoA hydratase/carnithine racemase [Myxococcota bacterium]|jgi:enoyl-CoA hydratase/carnithine racemase